MNGSPEHLFIGAIDADHASLEGGLMILVLFILVSGRDLHLGFLDLLLVGGGCWAPAHLDMLFLFQLHLNLFLLFGFFLRILFNHCLSIEVSDVDLSYWHVLLFKLCESLIQFLSVEITFFERCPSLPSVAVINRSNLRSSAPYIHYRRRLTWRERWEDLRGSRAIVAISALIVMSSLNLGEWEQGIK
jgi:hypothetical protein